MTVSASQPPPCPYCGWRSSRERVFASGSTQYRCSDRKNCGRSFTPNRKPSGTRRQKTLDPKVIGLRMPSEKIAAFVGAAQQRNTKPATLLRAIVEAWLSTEQQQ